ncbi:MAG: F0F1 ATP synthase subunit delta [Anaerolineae bacterium]|nr:F0F1 ATP synthase subunit delta [Anaerolineae bacterium]
MELIPDFWTVIFEIVNFLVLAFLLYRFAFRPISANIKAHAAEKAAQLQQLQADHEAVEALRMELQERLANAEDEASAILANAKEQAELDRQRLVEAAQAEVERTLAAAQIDAYRLRKQAVDEFHTELLQGIIDVSALIVGQVSPPELHDELVKQLNDRIWELGRSEMSRVEALRRSLGERTPLVVAHSAKNLSPKQQGDLIRTFTAFADRNVNLDLKIDPALGLGIKVRIGDIVVDNTIAGKLDELRDEVSEIIKEKVADE